jgi:hypothetical protein
VGDFEGRVKGYGRERGGDGRGMDKGREKAKGEGEER